MTFNKLLMYNEYELILNYFLKKNIQDRGGIQYKYLKSLIRYRLDYLTDYEARKIFNILVRLGYFEKKKIINTRRSYQYKFINPYIENKKKDSNIITIYFD